MLRGNHLATVDEKGRVKIPAAFLASLREYGNRFFVTSENGDYVRIYPMKFWNEIEEKLAKLSSHNRTNQKFLLRANYSGQGGGEGAGHTPGLAEEVLHWLDGKPEGTYLDATLGLGGHSVEIARRLTTGRLIGLDRDEQALEIAGQRLKEYEDKVTLVHADFSRVQELAGEMNWPPLDGVLADLGVSSMQLDRSDRGFSFRAAGPLGLRMDLQGEVSVAAI